MSPLLHLTVVVLMYGFADGRVYKQIINVANGGSWGDWKFLDMCPDKQYARGFAIKVEHHQPDKADDTSLNGIRLVCTDPEYKKGHNIESAVGGWGEWTTTSWCPSGVLVSFSLQVESKKGYGDDTAANNIRFYCSGGVVIDGYGGHSGKYGPWSDSCLKGVCGIMTRVEDHQGSQDDTALNDVRFFCCTD
ncbi:vitelline membrane outer layer protein 1 homolog isoform X2 [Ambystoma mexicanum]